MRVVEVVVSGEEGGRDIGEDVGRGGIMPLDGLEVFGVDGAEGELELARREAPHVRRFDSLPANGTLAPLLTIRQREIVQQARVAEDVTCGGMKMSKRRAASSRRDAPHLVCEGGGVSSARVRVS